MTLAVDDVLKLVNSYGYLVVFTIVLLDQAAISLPSPPFVMAMGALAANGRFQMWLALSVVFVAACFADLFWFQVGRSERLSRLKNVAIGQAGTKAGRIARLLGNVSLGGFLGVKFSVVPSLLAPFVAGATRTNSKRFAALSGLANFIWTAVFFFAGFVGMSEAGR